AIITSLELNQPGFNVALSYDWFTNQMNKAPSSARTTEVIVTLKKFIGKQRPTPNYYARAYKEEPAPKEKAPEEVKKPVEKPKSIDTVKAVIPTTPVDTAKPVTPKEVPVAPVVEPEKPKEEPVQVTEPAKPVQEPVKVAEPAKAPVKKAITKKKPAPKKATPKKKPAVKKPVVKKEPLVEETTQPEVPGTTTPVISKQEASYIEDVIQPQYSFNNANLKEEAVKELDSLIQIMNKYPTVKLEVQGHSCNIGTVADNLTLSQRRAEKAVEYLTTRGIAADRLVVKAIGKAKPKVPNTSENNRIINRRVEFRILEK
ncbi:MAG: OmpA family protein, partial [Flexibacteraceae bacterium]